MSTDKPISALCQPQRSIGRSTHVIVERQCPQPSVCLNPSVAELRPFRGLRYQSSAIGDIGPALAPPYDVIAAESQAALHAQSEHNVIRLELSEGHDGDNDADNRYTRAAATLREWRETGIVAQEERPSFYVYVQEFEHDGKRHRRTALFARMRLEPWEAGVMRPHEETMRGPKQDRLQLLRQLRTNVSPLFALYDDAAGRVAPLLEGGVALVDVAAPDGQRYQLYAIDDDAQAANVSAALADLPLYMLDGHHRYETALAYRDERRAQADAWTGDEPENFALVAITAANDPGLVLLPTHRLVRPASTPPDLAERLERYFDLEDVTPKSYDGTALLRLLARLTAAAPGRTAFGALGLEEGRLHLLTLRDSAAAQALMPERSRVWRSLDVNVLQYAVLGESLGLTAENADAVAYTEDAAKAMQLVESGRWPLAFLLNATRIDQMIAVADAGEVTPPKTTYFYPKLVTGLVLNAFE